MTHNLPTINLSRYMHEGLPPLLKKGAQKQRLVYVRPARIFFMEWGWVFITQLTNTFKPFIWLSDDIVIQ